LKKLFEAIIFDLDGTLLDTLTDIAEAMNAALGRFGYGPHPVEDYRYYVGDSVRSMVERTLPKEKITEQIIEDCSAALTEEYRKRWPNHTKPYPGIIKLLVELEKKKILKAVLSNKPQEFTTVIVRTFLGDFHFEDVVGVNEIVKKKPDPTAALEIASRLKVPPEKILYLGDTNTDMQTAVNAGMHPVGALWGFRTAEELKKFGAKKLVEKPLDVLKVLAGDFD
jgi:phosphoglycolate phosphatase